MVRPADWEKLVNPVSQFENESYILCYFLGSNVHQSYVDRLRKELCCKIVNIQMFNRLNGTNADYQVSDIGPSEFLGLIRKAKWVCTDSFHAIISFKGVFLFLNVSSPQILKVKILEFIPFSIFWIWRRYW